MFPLRAARKIEHTPYVTYIIVVITGLVFLWQLTLSSQGIYDLYMNAGFVPCKVGENFIAPPSLMSMITSVFIHGGWLHILGNMMFLLAFGPAVEDYLGKWWYMVFYLAAGVAGNLMHFVFNAGVCIPAVGASGAIMGVMGGFMLLYPGTRITTILLLFRIPIGIRDIPALYLLGGFFVVDLLSGLVTLGPATATTSGVAVWAHVGGFLVGFLMAFIGMTFKPLPPVDPEYDD